MYKSFSPYLIQSALLQMELLQAATTCCVGEHERDISHHYSINAHSNSITCMQFCAIVSIYVCVSVVSS